MKQETKKNPMKGYEKTNRNFQSTDEDLKHDKKEKAQLEPEEFPVEDSSPKSSK